MELTKELMELVGECRTCKSANLRVLAKLETVTEQFQHSVVANENINRILLDPRLMGPAKLILVTLAFYPSPLRQVDIIRYTALSKVTARKYLGALVLQGRIRELRDNHVTYYHLVTP